MATEADLLEKWEDELGAACTALVTKNDNNGPIGDIIVICQISENLSKVWQSGDLIAFWQDGDHTCLDGLEFDLLTPDLFALSAGEEKT